MKITICGSIKFYNEMVDAEAKLNQLGHTIFMPTKAENVDYWSEDNKSRVEAKRKFEFINEHLNKIKDSDAILVVNVTKNDIENYIGANTFLEMGFAHYWNKTIYLLNPIPTNQPYIIDELLTFDLVVLDGDVNRINHNKST